MAASKALASEPMSSIGLPPVSLLFALRAAVLRLAISLGLWFKRFLHAHCRGTKIQRLRGCMFAIHQFQFISALRSPLQPNPSIERTSTGGVRSGASAAIAAPASAAHVKR
jgi:hypothetical protein